jgi:hypothetical protein
MPHLGRLLPYSLTLYHIEKIVRYKHSIFFTAMSTTKKKSFITMLSVDNAMKKIFTTDAAPDKRLSLTSLFSLIYYWQVRPIKEHLKAFVPDKPFQPSLMFAGKAGAYQNEAPFRCYTLGWVPGLTHKH